MKSMIQKLRESWDKPKGFDPIQEDDNKQEIETFIPSIRLDALARILKQEQWNGYVPDSIDIEELIQVIARQI